jgi:hypothetical protein
METERVCTSVIYRHIAFTAPYNKEIHGNLRGSVWQKLGRQVYNQQTTVGFFGGVMNGL